MLTASRHIVFWSLPVTVLFIVLRAQIVRTILGSGEFSWSDTRLVAASLAVFSVSVVAQSLVLLFVRAYYASGRTKMPLIINLVSAIAIVLLSFSLWKYFIASDFFRYFFEHLLRVEGIAGTEALMLPLGYSLAMLLNLALFWWFFHKESPGFSSPLLKTFFQSFSAAVIMGFVSYVCLQLLARIFDLDTVAGIFAQGFFAGIVGIFVGVLLLAAMRSQELSEVWKAFHARFWKTKVIVSEEAL
jgi:putative peptidoglycan lipid II flippase